METRRQNDYGVDVAGPADNVDRAMAALLAHDELLAACKSALEFFDASGGAEHEEARSLRAAIARATGAAK